MIRGAILVSVLATSGPIHVAAQESRTEATDILQTILLPRVSEILRQQGVPSEDVAEAVLGARDRRLPPAETQVILEETSTSIEEHGPVDNFGAFVQSQLAAGLRGRELAAAIRAEHGRRGIGKGKKLPPRGRARGRGERRPNEYEPEEELEVEDPGRRGDRTPEAAPRRRPDTTEVTQPRGRRPDTTQATPPRNRRERGNDEG